jgi:hypothetical protein
LAHFYPALANVTSTLCAHPVKISFAEMAGIPTGDAHVKSIYQRNQNDTKNVKKEHTLHFTTQTTDPSW